MGRLGNKTVWGTGLGVVSLVGLAVLLVANGWFAPPPPDEFVRGLDDRHAFYTRYRLLLGASAAIVAGLLSARRLLAREPRAMASPARTAVRVLIVVVAALCVLEASVVAYERRGQQQAIPDPQLGYVLNPGVREVNEFGLRNPPMPWAPRESETRILCLGDSCTFGSGSDLGYPAYLEAWLQSHFPDRDITVLNAGTPGYSSSMGLTALSRCLAMGPRYVLWSYAQNDCREVAVPDSATLQTHARGLSALLRRSHFYGFLREECLHYWGQPVIPTGEADSAGVGRRVPEAEVVANLEEAARLCAAANVRFIVVSLPDRDLDEPSPSPPAERTSYLAIKARYRVVQEEKARALGIPVIDAARAFRGRNMEDLFIWDHYHPTPVGYRIIGRYVAQHFPF